MILFLLVLSLFVETKQLDIPEYPGAFNPSLIAFDQGYLLTFRWIPNQKEPWFSNIGVVLLDEEFEPLSTPQLLATPSKQGEDARVFIQSNNLYLIYNDSLDVINPRLDQRRDMFIAPLLRRQGHFYLGECVKQCYPYPSKRLWEKNWVPFVSDGKVFYVYTFRPPNIMSADLSQGKCQIVHGTKSYYWKWGEIRGGTPALPFEGEYLTFFHSSVQNRYFMGAYTFESKPPFTVTAMTREPLIAPSFYDGKKKKKEVIFPGGFVTKGKYIYLAYGRDDCEVWIATIDKELLKKTLQEMKKKG